MNFKHAPDPRLWKHPHRGVYYVRFYDGSRHRHQTSLCTHEEMIAQRRFADFLSAYVRGQVSGQPVTRQTFSRACEWFIETKKAQHLKEKSITKYQNHIDRLKYLICVQYLDEITPAVLAQTRDTLSERNVARGTINHFLTFLVGFFEACATRGWIKDNPMQDRQHPVKRLKVRGTDKRFKRDYEPEEIEKILGLAAQHPYGQLYLILKTLYLTGMREEELNHLQTADIDLAGREIHVRAKEIRYVTKTGTVKEYRWTPKSGNERVIPIDSRLHGDLASHLRSWHPNIWRFVFTSSTGKKVRHVLKYLKKLTHEAEIQNPQELDLHSLRRSFISHSLKYWNRNPAILMKIVGHADLETLLKYLRVSVEDMHREIQKVG